MYGVYPNKDTSVFYQYMVQQNGVDCEKVGHHGKHHGKGHHKGEGGGGNGNGNDNSQANNDKKNDNGDDKDKGAAVSNDKGKEESAVNNDKKDDNGDDKEHKKHKEHKHKKHEHKCAIKDVEVDDAKWINVGGKDFKYAYIEFQVLDGNGNDITATTKSKINVKIDESALTAYLMKIKHHPSPAIIMATVLLCGIIVGINLMRRRYA